MQYANITTSTVRDMDFVNPYKIEICTTCAFLSHPPLTMFHVSVPSTRQKGKTKPKAEATKRLATHWLTSARVPAESQPEAEGGSSRDPANQSGKGRRVDCVPGGKCIGLSGHGCLRCPPPQSVTSAHCVFILLISATSTTTRSYAGMVMKE